MLGGALVLLLAVAEPALVPEPAVAAEPTPAVDARPVAEPTPVPAARPVSEPTLVPDARPVAETAPVPDARPVSTPLYGVAEQEPDGEPFLDAGGAHLMYAQASHAVMVGTMFLLMSGQNGSAFAPLDDGLRYLGAGALALHIAGSALLIGHYLRPSVAAAWLATFSSFAGFVAGFSPALKLRRATRVGVGTGDPDYPVGVALGAGIGSLASLLVLIPRDRETMTAANTLIIVGSVVTVSAVMFGALAAKGLATSNPYRPVALVVPVALTVLMRLTLGSVVPEPWFSNEGGGVTVSGQF